MRRKHGHHDEIQDRCHHDRLPRPNDILVYQQLAVAGLHSRGQVLEDCDGFVVSPVVEDCVQIVCTGILRGVQTISSVTVL